MSGKLSLVHGAPLESEPGQGMHSIPGYLDEVCGRFGDADAVIMRGANGRASWSYADLHSQSAAVAAALIASGYTKGARIGILMANRLEYLAALFGIAMAGGVAVALSTFSTRDELDHLLEVSKPELVFFDTRVMKQDFASMLTEIAPATRLVQLSSVTDNDPVTLDFESWSAFLESGKSVSDKHLDERTNCVTPDDTVAIFFSSGTTSQPKGIIHSHRAFCIQWWRWPRVFSMREPVRSWTGNGFFWSGNVSMTVGTALSTGGAIILQPAFEAESALAAIEEERVTFLAGRPHQWARVQAAPNWESADLSSLKYVTKGDLITEHPSIKSDWSTPNAFGTTETMTICTAFDAETSAEIYAGSVGVPLPGNILKIIDTVSGEIMPIGVRGEMCIKGPTLMQGYLGKDRAKCVDEEHFYHTGDGGYVDSAGRFFWEGRLTSMIKTGGANVAPDEVDLAISTFPGVKRSQTIGLDDALLGEEVVSCIVPLDGVEVAPEALTIFLKQKLASYKIPRKILIFAERDFAMTGNEKPIVAEIKAKALERLAANA